MANESQKLLELQERLRELEAAKGGAVGRPSPRGAGKDYIDADFRRVQPKGSMLGKLARGAGKVAGPLGALLSTESAGEGSDIVSQEQIMASQAGYKPFPSEQLERQPSSESLNTLAQTELDEANVNQAGRLNALAQTELDENNSNEADMLNALAQSELQDKKSRKVATAFSKDAGLNKTQTADLKAAGKDKTPEVKTEFQRLMDEYDAEKKAAKGKQKTAGYLNAMLQALNSLGQYGVDRAAAKAQIAGGVPMQAKQLAQATQIQAPTAPDFKETLQRLKALKATKPEKAKYSDQELRDAPAMYKHLTGNESPPGMNPEMLLDNMNVVLKKASTKEQKTRVEQADERIGLGKVKIGLSKQRLQLANVKHGYKVGQDDETDALKYQSMAAAHPAFKFAQGINNDIKAARDVLERAQDGESTALKTLGVKLAKAFGEKGALSESDVTRYIQDPSIIGWINSKGAEYKNAKITPEVYSSINNILADMEQNSAERLDVAYTETAKKFSRSRDESAPMSYDKALFLVNPDYSPEQIQGLQNTGPYGDTVTRKGKNYKWNATKGKYQLVK